MSEPVWTSLAVLAAFGLVFLNACFVAAEFSLVRVRRTRLEELVANGSATARVALTCLDELNETLSATQLGITLVSLGLGWLGESSFSRALTLLAPGLFPRDPLHHHLVAAVLSFFAITVLHVVLGELVPKNIAIQDAEKLALYLSRPLRMFHVASRPLIILFSRLGAFTLHRLGYHGAEEEPLTEQELKLVMKESTEEGVLSATESQIIDRAFEFADKRAHEIMVPRERVDFLSLARPVDRNIAVVKANNHTRFPLCEGDFDHVVGIVHMKDVWPELLLRFSNEAFQAKSRAPIYVAASLKQDQLMRLFQSARAHLAVVRDEAGRNVGIVTLEDVLERLVGDIRDEHGN